MTLLELKKFIKSLNSIDTLKLTVDEIKKTISPILGNHFLSTQLIDQTAYIFRTTRLPNNEKPVSFDQIIYPPKDIVTDYQRVNRPENPVFYASSSIRGAVLEGRLKKNDKIVISEWEVLPHEVLIPLNIGYTGNLNDAKRKKLLDDHITPERFKKSKIEIEKNKLILEYLSSLFSQEFNESHNYKLSIAISEVIGFDTESNGEFYKIGHDQHEGKAAFDGILFPSIQAVGGADNIAIRRYSFHKKIKLVSVDYCIIEEISATSFEYKELDYANSIDHKGKIVWKGRAGNYVVPRNVKTTLKMISENTFRINREDEKKLYRN